MNRKRGAPSLPIPLRYTAVHTALQLRKKDSEEEIPLPFPPVQDGFRA